MSRARNMQADRKRQAKQDLARKRGVSEASITDNMLDTAFNAGALSAYDYGASTSSCDSGYSGGHDAGGSGSCDSGSAGW